MCVVFRFLTNNVYTIYIEKLFTYLGKVYALVMKIRLNISFNLCLSKIMPVHS